MSFSDTIFLFFLALVLFGPKKLPEMARQAGRLLAELRRASNEFKSQIETEIAHLEIQKEAQKDVQNTQSTQMAPQGAVASLSLNPAVSESIPHRPEAAATLAAPTVDPVPIPPVTTGASPSLPESNSAPDSSASTQASHV